MATLTLFIYGTLKRGSPQNRLLTGQQFLGTAETLPQYRLYENGLYPCLVHDQDHGTTVHGELWTVTEQTLASIDEYEGAPSVFSRQPIAIAGQEAPVWAYFFLGDVSSFRDCGGTWPSPSSGSL